MRENDLLLEDVKVGYKDKVRGKRKSKYEVYQRLAGLPSHARWSGSRSSLCTSSSATLSVNWRQETGRVITLPLTVSPLLQLNDILRLS